MRKSNFLLHFLSVLLALPFLTFSLRITPVAGQLVDEEALPNYRLYFLESNENLTILSETVTLDITDMDLRGWKSSANLTSVYRLKNYGNEKTVKIALPLCGMAIEDFGLKIKVDGTETEGKFFYGERFFTNSDYTEAFSRINLNPTPVQGSGTLYSFDIEEKFELSYTVQKESYVPVFHQGADEAQTNETSFSAKKTCLIPTYELFVGGKSTLTSSNATYQTQSMTYEEYFDKKYSEAANIDEPYLFAPREYHHTLYKQAVENPLTTNIVTFLYFNDLETIYMLYVVEFPLTPLKETEIQLQQTIRFYGNLYYTSTIWECNYSTGIHVRNHPFSFIVVPSPDCPYLLENDLNFLSENGVYKYSASTVPDDFKIALCAEKKPELLSKKEQRKENFRKALTLIVCTICLITAVILMIVGFKKDKPKNS